MSEEQMLECMQCNDFNETGTEIGKTDGSF